MRRVVLLLVLAAPVLAPAAHAAGPARAPDPGRERVCAGTPPATPERVAGFGGAAAGLVWWGRRARRARR